MTVLRKLGFVVLVGVVCLLVYGRIPAQAAPDDVTAVPSPGWQTPYALTNTTFGAQIPAIAASADGSELIVAYNKAINVSLGNSDPWYVQSLNGSETWINAGPIYTSDGVDSVSVSVAIDSSNRGHAVWVEGVNLIYYLREDQWGTGTPKNLSTMASPLQAADPVVVATGNIIDVVWSQLVDTFPPTNPNVWHVRSTDGGTTWGTPIKVYESDPTSNFLDAASDSSANLYVVWQENERLPSGGGDLPVILFAQRVNGTWSTPVTITDQANIPAGNGAYRPQITRAGSTLYVTFTVAQTDGVNVNPLQSVYGMRCSSQCQQLGNWSPLANPISGSFVEVSDQGPGFINSSLLTHGRCLVNFFHGGDTNIASTNEIIWHVSDCAGWGNPQKDTFIENTDRVFYPSAASPRGWQIYLAYQRGTGANSEIYFQVFVPGVYLPAVMK